MTPLEAAKQQLIEMLKKYPTDTELSIELQTLYTLVEATIQMPKSIAAASKIRN